jgi:hypothetical protein
VITLAHILWGIKSIIYVLLFDIALAGEVTRFLCYNPQTELPKRKVVDTVLRKQYIEALGTLKEIILELTSP